jgi:hypothetical protein
MITSSTPKKDNILKNDNILYNQKYNIKEFKNDNIYTIKMITSPTLENDNIQAFSNDNIYKAWMLSFSSVEDVIIFHGVNVITFKFLYVIIF